MTGVATMTARQLWGHIAQGMQQDLQALQALQALLHEQFHAALRHDAQGMQLVAERIEAQAQQLDARSNVRVTQAKALLPANAPVSMRALFAQLKEPLHSQMLQLWERLELLVAQCQAQNLRNCTLIMEQAEIMRHVLAGGVAQEGVYGPG